MRDRVWISASVQGLRAGREYDSCYIINCRPQPRSETVLLIGFLIECVLLSVVDILVQ